MWHPMVVSSQLLNVQQKKLCFVNTDSKHIPYIRIFHISFTSKNISIQAFNFAK